MKLLKIGDQQYVNLDLVTDVVIASSHAVQFYFAVLGPDGEQHWSTASGDYAKKVIDWLKRQPDATLERWEQPR